MSHVIDPKTMPKPTKRGHTPPEPGAYEYIDRENGNVVGIGTFELAPEKLDRQLVGRRIIDSIFADQKTGLPILRTVTAVGEHHLRTVGFGGVMSYLCLIETL